MKPALIPTYATDAVLTGGPQSGSTTRLDAGLAVRSQGFYTDRRLPARALGWLFGTIGDWFSYFAPAQIKNWKLEGSSFLGATTNHADLIWLPEGYQTPPSGQWYIFSSTPTPVATMTRFPAFVPTIADQLTGPALDTWLGAAASTDGSLLIATGTHSGNGVTYVSSNRGTSWTAAGSIVNLTSGACAFSPVSNWFVYGGATDGFILTSNDGISLVNRGLPTGITTHFTTIKAAGGLVVAVDAANHVTVSSDGGVTWSTAFTSPVSGTFGVAYCSQYGWCLVGSSGIARNSAMTSSGWTVSTPTTQSITSIASDGVSRFAMTVIGTHCGVLYSDDGAVTWSEVRFSTEVAPPSFLPTRIQWSGEQWAVLGTPTTATTGYSLHTSLKL